MRGRNVGRNVGEDMGKDMGDDGGRNAGKAPKKALDAALGKALGDALGRCARAQSRLRFPIRLSEPPAPILRAVPPAVGAAGHTLAARHFSSTVSPSKALGGVDCGVD